MIQSLGGSSFLLKVPRVSVRAKQNACSGKGAVGLSARHGRVDGGRWQAEAPGCCPAPVCCANACVLRPPASTCSCPVCLQLFNVWVEPEVVVDVRQEGALDLIFESGEAR